MSAEDIATMFRRYVDQAAAAIRRPAPEVGHRQMIAGLMARGDWPGQWRVR